VAEVNIFLGEDDEVDSMAVKSRTLRHRGAVDSERVTEKRARRGR
jgi:hypothetical protein